MNAHSSDFAGSSTTLSRPKRSSLATRLVLIICAFLACALIWAANAHVDETSRAEGRVIPSGKTQIIQSSQAGVVSEILVRAGEQVSKGQLLVRLDDTSIASSAGEVEAKVRALQAQVARLRLESEGRASEGYTCPEALATKAPEVCVNESNLLQSRQQTLANTVSVLQRRVERSKSDLGQALSNKQRLEKSQTLAKENLDLIAPLAEKGLVSQSEFITSQREVNDLSGELKQVEESITGLRASLSEAELQVQQAEAQFREEALTDLTLRLAELSSASESLRGASDRVSRAEIVSPVDGVVNEVDINTIGGFVNAGERLMDVVPASDKLLIEAKLKPSDVAFIIPGQTARIKLTAYDFSIFGGLEGEVVNVSADSIVDKETREVYYIVLIEAPEAVLHYHEKDLPILPGMVTNVEILTGNKTVLHYLLKPINKARTEALTER